MQVLFCGCVCGYVESVRSWEKNPPSAWGNMQAAQPCRSEVQISLREIGRKQKEKQQHTVCLRVRKLRERLFAWQDDSHFFFIIYFFKEQNKVAVPYVNLVNAEVAIWQQRDWAHVHAAFIVDTQHCLSTVPNYSDKTQSYCWHKQDKRSLSHGLWPEHISHISHQILLNLLFLQLKKGTILIRANSLNNMIGVWVQCTYTASHHCYKCKLV